jgi:hypothetical protein
MNETDDDDAVEKTTEQLLKDLMLTKNNLK